MKNSFLRFLAIVVTLSILMGILPIVVLAVTQANFSLSPSIKTAGIGQVFSVDIILDASTQAVDTAGAYIDFDPTYLIAVDGSGNILADGTAGIVPGHISTGHLSIVNINSVDNTLGKADLSCGKPLSGGTAANESGVLGTIYFKAVAEIADTSISFHTAVPRKTKAVLSGSVVTGTLNKTSINIFVSDITPPTVMTISPSSGPTTGGTIVTITGTGFVSGNTTATIGGNSATGVTFVSTTLITVVTPAGMAGAKNVEITTPGGSTTLTAGFTYVADNSGGGGGGGGSSSNTTAYTSIFGNSSSLTINSAGVVQQAFSSASTDGKMSLAIPAYTQAKNADGTTLTTLTEITNSNPPAVSSGNVIGLAIDFGPSGAAFSPPITFVYHYTAADFGTGVFEVDLTMAFYDTQTGTWVDLKQKYGADYVKVDKVNDTITAVLPHFTTFAVIHKVSTPSLTPLLTPTLVLSSSPTAIASPAPAPSPIPTQKPTYSAVISPSSSTMTVSSSITAPPSPSLSPSSVASPVTAVSHSPESVYPANTFNWALLIGIIVSAITVIDPSTE